MSCIKVPVEDLMSAADKLMDYATECEGLLDRLDNAVKAVKGDGWKGDSVDALKDATDSNSKHYKELTNDLLNLAGILEQFATQMKDHDLKVKAQIG